jgi:hypothetical protein
MVYLVESVDSRLRSIGDETIKMEKYVRVIKGDSALLTYMEEDYEENSCIKVAHE